jgi:hypothetical protein
MDRASFEVRIEDRGIAALGRALRAEANGAQLRKELIVELRQAVGPGVSAVRSKLRAIPSQTVSSPPLGSYLASRTKPQVRLSGRSAGVAIRIPQTPNLRGFKLAAKRLNRTHWRHRVFGRDVWVTQDSPIPGFFDDTLAEGKQEYLAAVLRACRKFSLRLGRRF